jgi:hypothetical protein
VYDLCARVKYDAALQAVAAQARKDRLDRVAIAIVPFGIGGVLLNILNYAQRGLRDYNSCAIWLIASGISSYGTIWNTVAALECSNESITRKCEDIAQVPQSKTLPQ